MGFTKDAGKYLIEAATTRGNPLICQVSFEVLSECFSRLEAQVNGLLQTANHDQFQITD